MGEAVDIVIAGIFGVVTIVAVVRGIRRGDPSKKIRERAVFFAMLSVVGLRGLFPVNSWRVSAGYIAVLLVLLVVALWKDRRQPTDDAVQRDT